MLAIYQQSLQQFLRIIQQTTIWKYILPGLLVALLFLGIQSFFAGMVTHLLQSETWLFSNIGKGLNKTTSVGASFMRLMLQFIVLTLFSPINSLLSEKADQLITQQSFLFPFGQLLKDVFRAFGIICISGIIYLLFLLLWGIVSRVVGIQAINSYVYFLLSSALLGFSFFDYSLERHRFSLRSSYAFGSKNFLHLLIVGLIFNLIFIIPYIGVVLAPFLATLISTIIYLNVANKSPNILHKSIQE